MDHIKEIKSLRAGQCVNISGVIYTMRDAASSLVARGKKPPFSLKGAIIYNCGPIMKRQGTSWKVLAAGPTTSARIEMYLPKLFKAGVKGIIGKGGFSSDSIRLFKQFGCSYFQATGGAAQLLASRIKKVADVFWLKELGMTNAIWALEVEKFPAIVTIDSKGLSLHKSVYLSSQKNLKELIGLI